MPSYREILKTCANRPRFALGRLLATPAALAALIEREVEPNVLVARHVRGDWGALCDEDRAANERAVNCGDRILSSYVVVATKTVDVPPTTIWVITEADRSCTTILLPGDY